MENPISEKQQFCLNCHHPLPPMAQYCPECGQKCTDGRITFGQLFHEFFDTVFNFDSKIFVSIGALFVPGKLTIEYFKGRHKRYLHPVRILLVAIIVFVAVVSFYANFGDGFEMNKVLGIQEHYQKEQFQQQLDSVSQEVKKEYANPKVSAALDDLNIGMSLIDSMHQDSVDLDRSFNIGGEKSPKISNKDYFNLSPAELIEKYNVTGFWSRLVFKQKIKFFNQSGNFLRYLISRVGWGIFIMIPLFSLALKLLYIRRNYLYVEHFVYSMHGHAFLLTLLTIAVLTESLMPEFLVPLLILWAIVYLFLAQKRMYKQKFFKTFVKFCLLAITYFFLLIVAMVATVLAGFLLF